MMITSTSARISADIARQQRLSQAIDRDMLEITTEKRIQTASDDPVNTLRATRIATRQSDNAAWTGNISRAAEIAQAADDSLYAMQTALDRARELMLAGASDTLSTDGRAALATEMRVIAEELATLAQSRDARGDLLFPAVATSIPIGQSLAIAPSGSAGDLLVVGSSLSDILIAAADALETTPAPDFAPHVAALEQAADHITALRADVGARAARIDRAGDRLATEDLALAEALTEAQGADLVAVLARLQSRQLTLEAAQSVYARLEGSTLFDLLR